MDVLTNLIVIIMSQHTHISTHHIDTILLVFCVAGQLGVGEGGGKSSLSSCCVLGALLGAEVHQQTDVNLCPGGAGVLKWV